MFGSLLTLAMLAAATAAAEPIAREAGAGDRTLPNAPRHGAVEHGRWQITDTWYPSTVSGGDAASRSRMLKEYGFSRQYVENYGSICLHKSDANPPIIPRFLLHRVHGMDVLTYVFRKGVVRGRIRYNHDGVAIQDRTAALTIYFSGTYTPTRINLDITHFHTDWITGARVVTRQYRQMRFLKRRDPSCSERIGDAN